MDYTSQQIETIISGREKEKPPDYSIKHKNLAQYYAHLWKTAAQTRLSRTLWFLLLVLYVLFISLPMLQSLFNNAFKDINDMFLLMT